MGLLTMKWGSIRNYFLSLMGLNPIERKKTGLLAICFFLVFATYTVVRELKDFVFISIVGYDYLPLAKIVMVVALIPMVFLYSRLVDLLRRDQLLSVFTGIYAVGWLISAYFLGHPSIGLSNTDTGKFRLFGWIFYLFMEGSQPFLIGLLWSFLNTVTKPEDVKGSYVFLTASSKVGGALAAGSAWLFLNAQQGDQAIFSGVGSFQLLLVVSAVLLAFVPLVISYLMHKIPHSHLHGYEAAYQFEKAHEEEHKRGGLWETVKGMFSGLYLLIRYPYALGIFGMVFFWEVVNVTFNYLRLGVGKDSSHSILEFGAFLYGQIFFMHVVGFVIVLFGTGTLVRWLGERKSLIIVPLATGGVIAAYLISGGLMSVGVAYIIMRAINYAFAYPLRESLYIPATKAIKFKTKSWIDGFGAKLAKSSGSYYNILIQQVSRYAVFNIHLLFFTGIICVWAVVANLLGRRLEKAIKNNEVIGTEEA
ncbi:TPA: hypothetical protein DDZ86_03040 [Candidatus Dependentiae bacterium]|nr:MAG: Plastidic atp adp transporter [candidate division TM6 bacterium GW2011_GWF2_43_87]HBL98595.1 hypothetical protein [Candidatus Dependentiae bacterium]